MSWAGDLLRKLDLPSVGSFDVAVFPAAVEISIPHRRSCCVRCGADRASLLDDVPSRVSVLFGLHGKTCERPCTFDFAYDPTWCAVLRRVAERAAPFDWVQLDRSASAMRVVVQSPAVVVYA